MKQNKFKLKSEFAPSGDQPNAIKELVAGVEKGLKKQTLFGDGEPRVMLVRIQN